MYGVYRVPRGLASSRSSVCGCFGEAVSVFFTRWAGKPFAWKIMIHFYYTTLFITSSDVTSSVCKLMTVVEFDESDRARACIILSFLCLR